MTTSKKNKIWSLKLKKPIFLWKSIVGIHINILLTRSVFYILGLTTVDTRLDSFFCVWGRVSWKRQMVCMCSLRNPSTMCFMPQSKSILETIQQLQSILYHWLLLKRQGLHLNCINATLLEKNKAMLSIIINRKNFHSSHQDQAVDR